VTAFSIAVGFLMGVVVGSCVTQAVLDRRLPEWVVQK